MRIQVPFGLVSLISFSLSATLLLAEGADNSSAPPAVANPAPSSPAPVITAHPKWKVTPDHKDSIYEPNQMVTWSVDFSGDRTGLNAVNYDIAADGQVQLGKGTLDLSTGPATIKGARPDPGVLVVRLYPPGKIDGRPIASGGAVISPEKIDLGITAPADFDSFWQEKLKALDQVPINAVEEKVDVSSLKFSDAVDLYKVTLNNIGGTHVYGQLAKPKIGEKFPAMLMLQFAGVYPLDKNRVIEQAKAGWLVLNISAHDEPIDEAPEFYNKLKATTLKDYIFIGNEDKDKCYFLRMILGCRRAVEYLASRPDWDGKLMLVTGTSQGGFQSLATAAFSPEVTSVAINVPAGCDFNATLATPPRAFSWPYWMAKWAPPGRDLNKVQITGGYYDAITFASRVHCPTLVAGGLIDDTARPTGVIAAHNAIKAPKKLIIMPLADHPGTGGTHDPYNRAFLVWRDDLHDGKPLPTTEAK